MDERRAVTKKGVLWTPSSDWLPVYTPLSVYHHSYMSLYLYMSIYSFTHLHLPYLPASRPSPLFPPFQSVNTY